MGKKVKETGIATVNALLDLGQDGIPQLLEQVNAKINAIVGDQVIKSTTDGKSFPDFGELKDITKVGDLIKMHSAVSGRVKGYNQSAKEIGMSLTKFPFKIEGCSAKQWLTDITIQTKILANKAELDKLKKVKQKLESNLSEQDKWKRDMASISTILTAETELE